jgi:hypothetical protein
MWVQKEADLLKMQIISRPLQEASPSLTAALVHWRTLTEFWPLRKQLLEEQLSIVEGQIEDNTRAVDKLRGALTSAKAKIKELVRA